MVTGGAGGIGANIVARFLNDGASVAIVDVDEDRAKSLLENEFKTASETQRVRFYKEDVSYKQNCFDIVDKVAKDFGKINYLINCSAYFSFSVRAIQFCRFVYTE